MVTGAFTLVLVNVTGEAIPTATPIPANYALQGGCVGTAGHFYEVVGYEVVSQGGTFFYGHANATGPNGSTSICRPPIWMRRVPLGDLYETTPSSRVVTSAA